MRNNLLRGALACCLSLVLALPCAACGSGTAAFMHLLRAEGEVSIQGEAGKSVKVTENMGLYSGYQLDTEAASYAWIEMDKTKLAKMDEDSEIEIRKKDQDLTIRLREGGIFFNVTEPLEDDETMEIRTSTMAIGIRGTCGWVSDDGSSVTVGLLEGKVKCKPLKGKSITLEAGCKAVLTAEGEISISPLTEEDIPAFVRGEADPLLEEALLIGQGMQEPRNDEDSMGSEDNAGGEEGSGSAEEQAGANPYELPAELDDGIERTVIEVATAQEMIALRNKDLSNTEIHLTADLYQLGDRVFDVYDAVNLRIIGSPSTRISGGKNGGDSIFFAKNCENLLLYQVEFGNDIDGDISESVSLYKCSKVHMANCVLYSGMYGVHGDASDGTMSSCEIRDCVTGGVYWRGGSLAMENCVLSENGSGSADYNNSPLFQLTEASLQMTDCHLYNNTCVIYNGGSLEEDGHGGRVWVPDGSVITETGTVSEGNLWEENNT